MMSKSQMRSFLETNLIDMIDDYDVSEIEEITDALIDRMEEEGAFEFESDED